jgi:hypothetical protein
MKQNSAFIKAIQDMIDNDPELPEEKRKALEAAKSSLTKDRWMEALRMLAPFFGEIGKMIFQHHEHR